MLRRYAIARCSGIAVSLLFVWAPAAGAEVHSVIQQRAAMAAESLLKPFAEREKPLTVGVTAFTYGETEAISPFLTQCRQAMSEAFVASGKCKVVEREVAKLNELLQEEKLRESGMTATQSASLLGNLLEAEAMLFGKATETEFRFRIDLELLSTADASKLAVAKMEFVKDEIPATGVRPTMHAQVQEAAQTVAQAPQTAGGKPEQKIEVGILPTRAHNPVYGNGEEIQFRVWANRDCYVRLVCIDAGGSKYQIFPNRYQSDCHLTAWTEHVIPSPDHPFRYKVVPPFGTEMILAFAATEPFDLPGFGAKSVGPITQLDAGAKGLIEGVREKGVGIFTEGGGYAEAHCVITTADARTRGGYIPIR